MSYINLAVTQDVIDYVERTGGRHHHKQIAIQNRSADLQNTISHAAEDNRFNIMVGNLYNLSIGDPTAIWLAHQQAGEQAEMFQALYDFLSFYPGDAVTFKYVI